MIRYTLTLPRETEAQRFQAWEIRSTLTTLFGGFTETEGLGGWRNEHGDLYREPVTVWTIDTTRIDAWQKLETYASWLAWKLGEEYVYITRHEIDTLLVPPLEAR